MTVPTLTDERRLMMWAGSGPAMLYLSMCFIAGFLADRPLAWRAAAFSAGFAYIATAIKSYEVRIVHFTVGAARVAFLISLIAGTYAGICLL